MGLGIWRYPYSNFFCMWIRGCVLGILRKKQRIRGGEHRVFWYFSFVALPWSISPWSWISITVVNLGPARMLAWTSDGRALAVGWELRGLAVWSISGCRLMCTVPQRSMHRRCLLSPLSESQFDHARFWDSNVYFVQLSTHRILQRWRGGLCVGTGRISSSC